MKFLLENQIQNLHINKQLHCYKVNEKIVCEDISVTNQISNILENNKWKIRFIPKDLGFWAFDGSEDNVWLKNRHFQGISFLCYEKKTGDEFKKWVKQIKEEKITDWQKVIRRAKAINKFRDIYDEIREILIANGLPNECMEEQN